VARRVGLTTALVVDAAVELLEERGEPDAVTLGAVASRLGVRAQSLYAHVDGLDGLRRELALRGMAVVGDAVGAAAIGRSGADAVAAIVHAYLDVATEHPGLYAASLRPPGDDPELRAAVARVTTPLTLVFRSYELDADVHVHWYRLVFATVHGFASLRRAGLLTLPGDPDATVDHIVRVFAGQLEADAAARAHRRPA
jgi:AcrR family transcriptional regulator